MSNKRGENVEGLAEDLRYFDALVQDDAQSLQSRVINAVEASANPYDHLKAVTNVMVENQAQLSARIKILEQVLLGNSGVATEAPVMSQPIAEHNYAPQAQVEVSAEVFGENQNMYGVEYTPDGVAYSWTGPAPEIVFDVPVLRDVEKVFRVRFISAMDDDELLKEAQIFVDGQSQQVELDFDGKSRGLFCAVPVKEGAKATRVEVKLIRTLSPAELGKGDDMRKLGLAVTGYSVKVAEEQAD
uniref:hypothetical protein n=1 Tax=Microbulbifer agarilyticus TaxID=260552 RepID=UPI000255B937|nr:hypothetical protein [Microbulbifer agarilyticus]